MEIKNKKLSIPKDIAEKYNEIRLDESSLLPKLYTNVKKSVQKEQFSYNLKQNILDKDNINTESTKENTEGGSGNINSTSKKNPNSRKYTFKWHYFIAI